MLMKIVCVLQGFIKGPPDSPYDGFEFELAIDIPGEYPIVPPVISK
jgi:ubiquitin-protein ligase